MKKIILLSLSIAVCAVATVSLAGAGKGDGGLLLKNAETLAQTEETWSAYRTTSEMNGTSCCLPSNYEENYCSDSLQVCEEV